MTAKISPRARPVPPARPLRIVLADNHLFLRDLMVNNLTVSAERHAVVAVAGNAALAVEACLTHQPDLLVLDFDLPGREQVRVIAKLRRTAPGVNVLLCTAFPAADRCQAALRVGARGFVENTQSWAEFVEAIDRVGRGEYYFCASSSKSSIARQARCRRNAGSGSTQLSLREQEVVRLIATGNTTKEIGNALYISPATAGTHRVNIMQKLGLRNVASLVRYAVQTGLVGDAPDK